MINVAVTCRSFRLFSMRPSCMITFPVVTARSLKPIRLNKLWAQSFPNFKAFSLSLSHCSIKVFATAIAIEKVACPPLYLIYFLTFSSMSLPRSSGLPRCNMTMEFSMDLLLFSESFIWARYFFQNPRTVLSFKSGNNDLNFRTAALQPVSLANFAN